MPRSDGSTLRQDLIQLQKMTGKASKELAPALIPYNCVNVYNSFLKLRRSSRGNPITYTEIKAYLDVTGDRLSPGETQAILLWDMVNINKVYELRKKQELTNIEGQ